MRKEFTKYKYVIGIDEVGRGPLAGPVSVGAVVVPVRHFKKVINGTIRDSKALTAPKREEWYDFFKEHKKKKNVYFSVASVGQKTIDQKGIVFALRLGIRRCLKRLNCHPRKTLVLLDGGLHAPEEFIFQKTISGGDRKESIIAVASIIAKVTRDKKMARLAKVFPKYEFGRHKGYGTKLHYEKIKKYGPCDLHRHSFLENLA